MLVAVSYAGIVSVVESNRFSVSVVQLVRVSLIVVLVSVVSPNSVVVVVHVFSSRVVE